MVRTPHLLLGWSLLALLGCDATPLPPPQVKTAPALPTAAPGANPATAGASAPGPVDPDAPEEFTTTASGLKYRIRRKSDGRKPTASDKVQVNYRGWLDDGKEFDSSYKRREPIDFSLNGVIPGWTEGMQLVGEGGMIELEIPYQLGYGERGMPPNIPGKSTLHFIVELLAIE
jgi:FKBP-type peptidyl-prolyl cis-trans isomerase FkpA